MSATLLDANSYFLVVASRDSETQSRVYPSHIIDGYLFHVREIARWNEYRSEDELK
jgi:hypothetical protein